MDGLSILLEGGSNNEMHAIVYVLQITDSSIRLYEKIRFYFIVPTFFYYLLYFNLLELPLFRYSNNQTEISFNFNI